MSLAKSPEIKHLSWGRMDVEGAERIKDAKLYPGGCRAWDWNETGTRHAPGIQVADVKELVKKGARVVILSKGMLGRLNVESDTLRYLESNGVETHVLKTEKAVDLYNELRENEPVGALIHSTC